MQCRQVVMLIRDCTEAFSQREDEETAGFCRLNSAAFQAGLRHAVREKLQIELLEATVSRIKLSPGFSLNDHTGLYATVLTEGGSSVATVVREVRDRLNMNELISRRDDTSLQGTVTITTAAKEAEEEEDVIMKVMLPRLIDAAASAFNLAFLTVMKTTTVS
ncbi:uncharacterized protein BDCG_18004 [Blastomyces dermatitidis ER-3]|uniref:Uncharacterized protein n=1 Tax=Ajellomyces dermatitidis (strain ER-3 / ATCC MYA-2586) TaxID=559297 RepID=A0ABX2W1I4_AJEDR|nr:uncharacterized protein BDCG_18004 [Blastomyces dermatitidis ER-3]OAT03246.1 hypothetical protein BDCG_18004 [Blastomyces dermatitidis ER-3]